MSTLAYHEAVARDLAREAIAPPKVKFESISSIGARNLQIWSCLDCGTARAWGLSWPWDRDFEPRLACRLCERATKHEYVGIVGFS